MTAVQTFVLLVFASVGCLSGLSGAFWLGLKVLRVPMGSPSPVGVLLFMGVLAVSMAALFAYMEAQR